MGEKASLEHINEKFDRIERALEELRNEALDGFPNKDPQGHRIYHEAELKKDAFWSKVRSEVLLHLVKAAALAVSLFLCVAAFNHIKGML